MSTYAEILPMAEAVTLEELANLLAESSGACTIYPGPRKHRRHALSTRLWHGSWVSFDYCDRQGFGQTGVADSRKSVFDFYNLGQIVRVAGL